MSKPSFSRAAMTALAVLAVTIVSMDAALARCTRLAFSVNDYGKDGPTKDAQALLDQYIAKWTSERGIKKYTTGKKEVSCELFLNFIVFDEHTCKAAATVCWEGNSIPNPIQASAPAGGAQPVARQPVKPATKSAAKPALKPAAATAPITTGTVTKPGAPATGDSGSAASGPPVAPEAAGKPAEKSE